MRRLGLALCLLLLCLLPTGVAQASPGQQSLFEAPRELMSSDAALRAQTLDQIQAFGVKWVRVVLYWRSVAPSPNARTRPAFDESDPNAYPGFGPYDRLLDELHA